MSKLIAYHQESKIELEPIPFLKDVISSQEKIKNINEFEATKQIGMFMTAQALVLGNLEIQDWNKKEIKDLVLSRFKGLTINELYYAFKLDRFGVYGDITNSYGNFNTVFVSQVLNKYINWRQKVRFDNNLPIGKPEKKISISDQEKKAIIFNGVMECYDHYKEHYLIPDGKTYVYDVLYDLDVLPKDKDTKLKIYAEAKEVLKTERQLKSLDRELSKQILIEIEKQKSDMVALVAKKISIGKYFRKINRRELIELLKNL